MGSAILTMSASPSPSSASACGCKGNISSGPVNTQCKQELESLMFEGGSDVFTSNRHALHNNEAKTFNLLTYRTQDDAPFFSPRPAASPYTSATVPVEREGCEKVTRLMLRSNIQVRLRHFIHLVKPFTIAAPSSTNIFIISVGEACSSLDPGRSLRVRRYSLFEGTQEQCSSFTVI